MDILPFIEMIVTTKCNLQCKSCSNLIPAYKDKYDVPLEEIKESLDILLEQIEELTYLKIHGGEPLLSSDICEIINYTVKKEKIKNIIVPTNGSFIPHNDVLTAIAKHKAKVKLIISNYEYCADNHTELIKCCKSYGINYKLSEEKAWYSFGPVKDYHYTDNELLEKLRMCEMKRFPSYYRGKLYKCSRIANAVFLGIIPHNNNHDYDLLHETYENRKVLLKGFFEEKMCGYCSYCTMDNIRSIKSGEQVK